VKLLVAPNSLAGFVLIGFGFGQMIGK
jgi:hypothetical protein